MIPIEAYGVKIMSMALLQPGDKPMIVRGPILHGLVKQFLSDVKWGELDYLIVDMPPGTGDMQLSLAQLVPVQGAVLVTTPQDVAVADVRRALRMFETVAIPILGIIENMSYFIAPDTGNRYNIFGQGGGEKLAEMYHVPLLGIFRWAWKSGRVVTRVFRLWLVIRIRLRQWHSGVLPKRSPARYQSRP